ncbi:GAF and HTH_10 associated domain-containing protein [Halogranum amylolyticum]|uniref:GAF and HTH_10 associated domain-containing protein n=1 Tax=Halogranum amylolyticum TaxID=660520 RepID=A0A1H8UA14_9EURY|nr:helix-turn-helix domain-containing protein [Halogranum amylolyticum]SEP00069.1 GAF and HTH_10 associated domain-containing protein [Halogranum amylolyticum]
MYTTEITTESPALYNALNAAPSMRVEYVDDRMVPDGPIKLIVWASGGDFSEFERALNNDPTIGGVRTLTIEETRRLYRINYSPEGECESLTTVITDLDATIIDAVVTVSGLWMKIQFPDQEAVRTFANWFQQHQQTFAVESVYEETELTRGSAVNLTDPQRGALALSHEWGYFEIPRETTATELASELDISAQAFSERIRRGTSTILEQLELSSSLIPRR